MNISFCQRNSFGSAIVAVLLSTQALFPLRGVDAAVWFDDTVYCHPEAPEICVENTYQTSPSPELMCAYSNPSICSTVYVGGYMRSYSFANGLPSVAVKIGDDRTTCTVSVGTDKCTSCSASCGGDSEGPVYLISYDCTNLSNGATSDGICEPMGRVFYPFVIEGPATMPKEITEGPDPLLEEIVEETGGVVADEETGASTGSEGDGTKEDEPKDDETKDDETKDDETEEPPISSANSVRPKQLFSESSLLMTTLVAFGTLSLSL